MDFQEYLNLQERTFVQYYRCLSTSALKKKNLDEDGNFVILPPSALDRLNRLSLNMANPMLFKIQSTSTPDRATHCGVLEFEASEGFIHMPSRLMAHLGVEENEIVLVRSAALPSAAFVKLRAHTSDFLGVSHHKELLEYNIRHKFQCLTAGETIAVMEGDRRFCLDVLEARPADAVCTINTDCEVDFAPPLDYVEPPPRAAAPAPAGQGGGENGKPRFTGVAARIDGKPVEMPSPAAKAAGAPGVPKRKIRFDKPTAAGSAVSKSTAEKGAGKEPEKRFTGTQYSLKD